MLTADFDIIIKKDWKDRGGLFCACGDCISWSGSATKVRKRFLREASFLIP